MSEKKRIQSGDKPKKNIHRKTAILRKMAKKLDDQDSPDDEDQGEVSESIFREHLERLKKLEKKGWTGEAYDIEVLKSLRTLVQDLIPVAEDNYRKFPSHTAASAMNQYINQERELLNDIRSLEDFRSRANRIVGFVETEIQDIAKQFIDQTNNLQRDFKERKIKGAEDLFVGYLKLFGRTLRKSQEQISDRILEFMVSNDKK